MPDNLWPPEISEAFTADTFAEKAQDVTIRTDMDTGPPKVRRRFINPVRSYPCSVLLRDAAEYLTLRDFYYVTCQGGTDTLLIAHPITGEMLSFRFAAAPEFKAEGIAWRASFQLELLP